MGTMLPRVWNINVWAGHSERVVHELDWRATQGLNTSISRFAEWMLSEPGTLEHYRGGGGLNGRFAQRR